MSGGCMTDNSNKDSQSVNEGQQIHRLREILFGQQFKDNESKFTRLEEKIEKLLESLRASFELRLNSMEQMQKSFIQDFENFKKGQAHSESEIRANIMNNAKNFSTELGRLNKELTSGFNTEIKILDELKVDRSSLASIFGDAVMHLNSSDKKSQEKTH